MVSVIIPVVFGVLTALLGGGAVMFLEWYHHGELQFQACFGSGTAFSLRSITL